MAQLSGRSSAHDYGASDTGKFVIIYLLPY